MAQRIKNPLLFSDYFGVLHETVEAAGLIDTFINVDTPLFIDPILLGKSRFSIIRDQAKRGFDAHFSAMFRLLCRSKKKGDAAWRAARRQLDLSEPTQNGLGYGTGDRAGASRPDELRANILQTAKEIIDIGVEDPDLISLMGLFEEGVGPDTISDLTTQIIHPQLAKLTFEFCQANGIPVVESKVPEIKLPVVTNQKGDKRSIVLVPKDIVRDLPIANDWADIFSVIETNASIRSQLNAYLGYGAKATTLEIKEALKKTALSSKNWFEIVLDAIREGAECYNDQEDALGYYRLSDVIANRVGKTVAAQPYDLRSSPTEVLRLVKETLDYFKHHVENGNLWEELWAGERPKRERAAQLIYFAMADAFCKANNIDISPEAHMGGGPVDFKFSLGYNIRVVVELKRSSGQVVSGYERQLDAYKKASKTEHAIFVIIDYGDGDAKIQEVENIRRKRLAEGKDTSEILVIDARKKLSASKR